MFLRKKEKSKKEKHNGEKLAKKEEDVGMEEDDDEQDEEMEDKSKDEEEKKPKLSKIIRLLVPFLIHFKTKCLKAKFLNPVPNHHHKKNSIVFVLGRYRISPTYIRFVLNSRTTSF